MIQFIADTLLANTSVTALVGNRIKPVGSNQGERLPYIVFDTVSEVPTRCREGIHTETIRVQVNVIGKTYGECDSIYQAVRTALDGATNGTLSCEWMNANDLYRDEASAHGKAIDFELILG